MHRLLMLCLFALPLGASAAPLSSDTVLEAIRAAARRNLPAQVVEIDVHSLYMPSPAEITPGSEVELRVRAGADDDWIGRTNLDVFVSVNGIPRDPFRASVDIVAMVAVPVLSGGLARNEIIAASDLVLTQREADRLPGGVLTDVNSIVGRRLKRDLGLNSLLRSADLDVPVDAERNHPVTLVVDAGALTVRAAGVLRQDAHLGDLVPVWTPATGSVVYGILQSSELVVVPLAPTEPR